MIFTKLNFRNSHQISNWYLHKQKSFSTKVPPQNHQNWILRYQEDYLCSQSNIFHVLCHFFQSISPLKKKIKSASKFIWVSAMYKAENISRLFSLDPIDGKFFSSQRFQVWLDWQCWAARAAKTSFLSKTIANCTKILWKKWHRTWKILLWLHR